MVSETQPDRGDEDRLLDLLSSDDAHARMLALHFLSESYSSSPRILEQVFDGWEQWGIQAFTEFPMLSYLAIPDNEIERCCQWAANSAKDRKLVEPEARCAGKLIEQLMRLPAEVLAPHQELLKETTSVSKIFFRVDLQGLSDRIELLSCTADQVAAVLDDSIATLTKSPDQPHGLPRGLIALEALRRQHPDYIDLATVLKNDVSEDGPNASFRVALHSLIQFPHPGTEQHLAKHLSHKNEAVFANVVEALVRAGTREAAEALLEHIEIDAAENRKWIARGLQRLRLPGLASGIAAVRDETSDPYLWLMLLIAEVRQLQADSMERISFDLQRLKSSSEALIDSLVVFLRVRESSPNIRDFECVATEYVQSVNKELTHRLKDKG